MMWSSRCSPTPCSTSCWRTDSLRPCIRQGSSRPLPRHRRALDRRARAGLLLRAATTPTRASSRRSSTCTCRWRSSRCAASSLGGAVRDRHLRTGDRGLGHALLRRDPPVADLRASALLITGSIWAQGVVGPLVGLERADAGLVPDRLPALRDLPAAALLDRGPRAPGALRQRCSRSSPAPSCRSTSSPCAWRRRSCTRAC